eukprot:g3714.t1
MTLYTGKVLVPLLLFALGGVTAGTKLKNAKVESTWAPAEAAVPLPARSLFLSRQPSSQPQRAAGGEEEAVGGEEDAEEEEFDRLREVETGKLGTWLDQQHWEQLTEQQDEQMNRQLDDQLRLRELETQSCVLPENQLEFPYDEFDPQDEAMWRRCAVQIADCLRCEEAERSLAGQLEEAERRAVLVLEEEAAREKVMGEQKRRQWETEGWEWLRAQEEREWLRAQEQEREWLEREKSRERERQGGRKLAEYVLSLLRMGESEHRQPTGAAAPVGDKTQKCPYAVKEWDTGREYPCCFPDACPYAHSR